MMTLRTTFVALSAATLLPLSSLAAPTAYDATLVSGVAAVGTAGGFSWLLNEGAGVDFWRVQANAGDVVTFMVDRLSGNFDPGLSFYGGTTTADTSTFDSAGNWGGLTFLGSLDDEHTAFMNPGPGGDPFGSFTIATSGLYTVAVGGSLSTDGGVYPYRITMTNMAAAVPEPETYALMVLGLVAVAMVRRKTP